MIVHRQVNFSEPQHVEAALNRFGASGDGQARGFDLVVASDVTYEDIGVKFDHLAATIARLLRRYPPGRALVAHETRLRQEIIATDGSDPALARFRMQAEAVGLVCTIVHDDRPRHEFARTGMRTIMALTHSGDAMRGGPTKSK